VEHAISFTRSDEFTGRINGERSSPTHLEFFLCLAHEFAFDGPALDGPIFSCGCDDWAFVADGDLATVVLSWAAIEVRSPLVKSIRTTRP
jgi:hypothetical protein